MSSLQEPVARWVRLQRELGIDDVVLDQPWHPVATTAAPTARSTGKPGPGPTDRTYPGTTDGSSLGTAYGSSLGAAYGSSLGAAYGSSLGAADARAKNFSPQPQPAPQQQPAPQPQLDPRAQSAPPPADRVPWSAPGGRATPPPAVPKPAPPVAAIPPVRPPVVARAAFPKFANLQELETHAKSCTRCVLAKRRRSVIASGGPERADWAILTLYAWAEDTDRNQILAGAYAAPLLQLATSLGLGAPAATAIFACTPDDPADTTIQGFTEAVRCRGHWLQRLKLSGAKAILVLDHKATTLARGPSAPVEWPAFRGQRWEIDGIPAFSTHHPSRMARQPALQPEVEADLKAILAIVKGP